MRSPCVKCYMLIPNVALLVMHTVSSAHTVVFHLMRVSMHLTSAAAKKP